MNLHLSYPEAAEAARKALALDAAGRSRSHTDFLVEKALAAALAYDVAKGTYLSPAASAAFAVLEGGTDCPR